MKLPLPFDAAKGRAPIALGRSGRGFARFASLCAIACASALSACSGDDSALPPVQPDQPPLARIWIPLLAAPAVAVTFDSSDSQSPGGEIAHYVIDYGDGSATSDLAQPMSSHTYAAEGVYAIELTVVDLDGDTASVEGQLTIRDDPPSCSADSDCDPGERCDAVCYEELASSAQ